MAALTEYATVSPAVRLGGTPRTKEAMALATIPVPQASVSYSTPFSKVLIERTVDA